MNGQIKVNKSNIKTHIFEISGKRVISNFNLKGIYIVQLRGPKGNMVTEKVIVK